jgi:WD40 repeat protein
MSKVVRSSHYRHVFGKAYKREECYDNVRVSRNAWDSNYITANGSYFSVIWDAGGGGAFVVVPYDQYGKLDTDYPRVCGHKATVLDIQFNPFNEGLIASCGEDCLAKIWNIPEGGLTEHMVDAVQTLKGHRRKVGGLEHHPVANNILATSSGDYTVKIWDIESGKDVVTVEKQHTNLIQSMTWNTNGSLIATSCKDKKIRIFDPRSGTVAAEGPGHDGVKGSRITFAGSTGKLFSTGFSRTSERQYHVWDPSDMSKPVVKKNIDVSSGLLIPFYDEDTNCVFIAGKGDGNIRYFELSEDGSEVFYLSEYKSSVPMKGICRVPKRFGKINECEIVRLIKLTAKGYVEPISFFVPRKSEMFQDDIFPPTFAGEPTLSAGDWLGGADADPKKISLEDGFVAKERPKAEFVETEPDPEEEGPSNVDELRAEWKKQKERIAYLEAEVSRRDAIIKDLKG